MVGKYPNVCFYTQALSEQLLQKMSECSEPRFPAVIVRFSTITAALQEPLPGWVANFNGPNGKNEFEKECKDIFTNKVFTKVLSLE